MDYSAGESAKMGRCTDSGPVLYRQLATILALYSLGVVFSHFLKVEQKLLSLLKPEAKAISLTGISGV